MLLISLLQKSTQTRTVTLDAIRVRASEIIERSDFRLEEITLSESSQWREIKEAVRHVSGKFFSVEGLYHRDDNMDYYLGPILNQPEIGYLGIICSQFEGVLKFLLQFKIEPGNINVVQLSPTLQATKSNFSQVHGGALPKYFDRFSRKNKTVLVDTLQTEQGQFFYCKRNRNIIIYEENVIDLEENFIWLTLGDILFLMSEPDLINMDTRTVLSQLILERDHPINPIISLYNEFAMFNYSLSFLNGLKSIKSSEHIIAENDSIKIGIYKIFIRGREVAIWDQPMLSSKEANTYSLLYQQNKDKGSLFALTLSTNSGIDKTVEFQGTATIPQSVLVKSESMYKLSEEGGRFYHMSNNYRIIEFEGASTSVLNDHHWMTYLELCQIILKGYSSMELRTLKLCYDAHISNRGL